MTEEIEDTQKCEGCAGEVYGLDPDGIPLCKECAELPE